MEQVKTLISDMQQGNRVAILNGLSHEGALLRINGIINAVKFSITDDEYIDKISGLTDDKTEVDSYLVSDFAYAALDLIGHTSYKGNNDNITRLIKSKFNF